MRDYLLYHRHGADDCAASAAAWTAFDSPLRGQSAWSTCAYGAHELWWHVTATDAADAIGRLPRFVASRTIAIRVAPLPTP
jgi:hypothetical protein